MFIDANKENSTTLIYIYQLLKYPEILEFLIKEVLFLGNRVSLFSRQKEHLVLEVV